MFVRTLISFCTFFALGGPAAFSQIAQAPPAPEWIGPPAESGRGPVFFRKSFEVQLPLLKAILLGACDGRMTVFLNGQKMGAISGRAAAQGLDLTARIRLGENVLALRAEPLTGSPSIAILLELNADVSSRDWVISDASWVSSLKESGDWAQAGFSPGHWRPARSLGRVDANAEANPFGEQKAFDAYNSWKLALRSSAATDPLTFTLPSGFQAELLRSAQPDESSWVALAFDPQGRITVARETRGLLRFTLGDDGVDQVEVIEDTLLECRGLLYAHGALYVNANNSKGFYRLRDTTGDDLFDEKKLLLATGGNVGHGRNQVVLGPDGSLWLVHGNDVHLPGHVAPASPLKHYRDDTLMPWAFDRAMFDGGVLLPAGHILRTDPEGASFELFAGGFRNPLDAAFNKDGEMFTFDADMEWDVSAPWYRPNRVNHVVSGADFGWRHGTAKWPDFLPDTLPATLDIGLASPTGIEFGQGRQFPPPFDEALFMADWAYGRILAVHLKPDGASYTASSELFVSGRPLNVTDLRFGPDGAMYFVTGGRRTQSGLYRVSYTGPKVARARTEEEKAREEAATLARVLRRELESFHRAPHRLPPDRVIENVWTHLGHPDVWIRHAARVALEQQDPGLWQAKAWSEERIEVALGACLALARVGLPEVQPHLIGRLNHFLLSGLSEPQLLVAVRTFEIAIARMGRLDANLAEASRDLLEQRYPAEDWRVNHRLCALLVHLESPHVIERTLPLIENSQRPEDLLQYLFFLRYVRDGWTPAQRALFFRALERAEQLQGGRDYYTVLKRVREESLETMSAGERAAVEGMLRPSGPVQGAPGTSEGAAQEFVREWTMEDFDPGPPLRGRSFERGKNAFIAAQCLACHRLGNQGGLMGPELAGIGNRFDRRALLESMIEPSRVIDEKFQQTLFTLSGGNTVTGTVEREDAEKVLVRENMLADEMIELSQSEIIARTPSAISPMPAGLLNGLNREQILDLLAFLESGGNSEHPAFRPQ